MGQIHTEKAIKLHYYTTPILKYSPNTLLDLSDLSKEIFSNFKKATYNDGKKNKPLNPTLFVARYHDKSPYSNIHIVTESGRIQKSHVDLCYKDTDKKKVSILFPNDEQLNLSEIAMEIVMSTDIGWVNYYVELPFLIQRKKDSEVPVNFYGVIWTVPYQSGAELTKTGTMFDFNYLTASMIKASLIKTETKKNICVRAEFKQEYYKEKTRYFFPNKDGSFQNTFELQIMEVTAKSKKYNSDQVIYNSNWGETKINFIGVSGR